MATRKATPSPAYPRQPVAARHRCPRCREWTLTGLDAAVCGLVTVADLVSLDPVGEMVALLAGLRTVELATDGRLDRRGPREIAAGQPRPVLAQHLCGRSNSGNAITLTKKSTTLPEIHGAGDEPPF